MTGITTTDMSEVARQLREAIAEHDDVCASLGTAEANYKKAYLQAHAASTTYHPERKVKEHDVAAEEVAFSAWAELNALTYRKRALTERMHSLRQILSAFQTQARIEAEFTGSAA